MKLLMLLSGLLLIGFAFVSALSHIDFYDLDNHEQARRFNNNDAEIQAYLNQSNVPVDKIKDFLSGSTFVQSFSTDPTNTKKFISNYVEYFKPDGTLFRWDFNDQDESGGYITHELQWSLKSALEIITFHRSYNYKIIGKFCITGEAIGGDEQCRSFNNGGIDPELNAKLLLTHWAAPATSVERISGDVFDLQFAKAPPFVMPLGQPVNLAALLKMKATSQTKTKDN